MYGECLIPKLCAGGVSRTWSAFSGEYWPGAKQIKTKKCYIYLQIKTKSNEKIKLPGVSLGGSMTGRIPKVNFGDLWYKIIVFDRSSLYVLGAGVSLGFSTWVFNPNEYFGVLSSAVTAFSGQYTLGAGCKKLKLNLSEL